MNITTIYKLEPVTDNPNFEGLATLEYDPSLLGRRNITADFFPESRDDWNWEIEKLSPIWQPLQTTGRVRSFNDGPFINLAIPAFSKRAAEGLRDLLTPNGELLPLVHPAGEYFAYNCTKIVEILDQGKCDAKWFREDLPAPALWIHWFAVRPELLYGLSIFRMRELCNFVFVTDIFVDRVRSLGLNGFEFVKVWPFPEGVDYRMENAKRRRERGQKVVSPTGLKEVKGESLVIEFALSDGKITAAEKKAISRFQDELDAQLMIHSLDEVYFGSLEGRSTKKGKTRLVLSCPDCKVLVKKLEPWLNSLEWPTKPSVYLRHGPWDDTAVQEIAI